MKLLAVDELIEKAIENGTFPGASYAVGYAGQVWQNALGRFRYEPKSEPTMLDTLWDLASVSKVVGTTTGAMILVEGGHLDLDRPVAEVLPKFAQNGKAHITPRNLMVHDSGLVAFRRYQLLYSDPEQVLEAIYTEELTYPSGTQCVYSDLSMIVLARLMEAISGEDLEGFLQERVFDPLGMKQTTYRPEPARCAPTEPVEPWREALRQKRNSHLRGPWIQGEVHDPTACVLGGVAGHAGLFSTVGDLARFMSSMQTGGIVSKETIRSFTSKQSDLSSRALGWDTKSPEGSSAGSLFGALSYGHTGFTGTSVWCDPDRSLWAVLLTNRVHPTAENTKIIDFRPQFHDEVFREVV